MTTYFFDRLAKDPHVLAFAGQSTPWVECLSSLCKDAELDAELHRYENGAKALLSPIYAELLANAGGDMNVFDAIENKHIHASDAQLSVPGIALAQLGAVLDLTNLGYNFEVNKPYAVLGHSQGVIAARMVEARIKSGSWQKARAQIEELLACAYIIGAAGDRESRMLEISGDGDLTPMLSLKGVTEKQAKALIARVERTKGAISIAVKNSRNHVVLSGYPEDMESVANEAQKEAKRSKKLREMKVRGGAVFSPVAEYLDVTVPFHSQMMEAAVLQAENWAMEAGLNVEIVRSLADEVLVKAVDWSEIVKNVLENTETRTLWILDMGPGEVLGKLTSVLVQGTGAGVVEASSVNSRANLSTLDCAPERSGCWADFAPRVIETPAGRKVLTKFSKLTGKAPVLLAGMTPTTVEPEIVAAAANAGYWAELAGGGQVTSEVFDRHMDSLEKQLNEGATVEFNAMFMDRYLWNLQFGSKRIVSKKRQSGAPIDGVVISAGIPEIDEAKELVSSLHADGFPYVAFKPGTVNQIRQVIRIAKAVSPSMIIAQVEGGSAGGHHSWESLDDLLISTYAQVRECDNLVLVAGGGIGTPARAADYISGEWANDYGLPNMPVDAVMIGTAAMTAKEAHTSPEVKRMLVETPGIVAPKASSVEGFDDDPFAPMGERWVPSGGVIGGVTSGLSHLHADIYELENSSAKCGRLLVHMMKHPEELETRRDEVISALNATAKPYFGDVETMTYAQFAQRFLDLAYPWVDPTYADRYLHLLQRIEARLVSQDSGEFTSTLPSRAEVSEHPQDALDSLLKVLPKARELNVVPMDAAWFPTLVREYPKPMPFVPVIDNDLLRWWGQDQLWQSEDSRYSADAVRVIPGPISVSGITTMDEPVANILARFESAMMQRAEALGVDNSSKSIAKGSVKGSARDAEKNFEVNKIAFSQIDDSKDVEAYVRACPNISWIGHVTSNPAYGTNINDENYVISVLDEKNNLIKLDLDIKLDTFWDNQNSNDFDKSNKSSNKSANKIASNPNDKSSAPKHAVRDIVIPLIVDSSRAGSIPVVDRDRLPEHVYNMLAATAGIGNTAITGDVLEKMPKVETNGEGSKLNSDLIAEGYSDSPFGLVRSSYTFSRNLGIDHESATAGRLPDGLKASRIVPDALVGPAWPTIYSALGSVLVDGYPIIEGLLNAVHLDHLVELDIDASDFSNYVGKRINLLGWAEQYSESASGRVVTIHVIHTAADGTRLAHETERFAIRGRSFSNALPTPAAEYGDAASLHGYEIEDTPRRALRRVTVRAPHDMTAFARTSGDFNPIHTSKRGAAISGLSAPLVHGMWLSATAQHVAQAVDAKGARYELIGWSYNMYGMVQLDDEVEITVERVGKVRRGGLALEVTCKVAGQIVSKASALTRAPRAAFVYPGQGIQKQGMSLDERAKSPAVRETWERADKLTREKLGFSILVVVRDNPKELTAHGVTYRHPEGLLNLTQFTQVALATVAFAQTARLRESGCDIWPAYFAGHSLGEYNALSSFAQIIPLETVLELVFHRGSTMHHLIDRDSQGRSNYRMGALRPNQFGVDDSGVKAYVDGIAKETGEFLQIVNYNLAGQQYAVAGTIKGLKALASDASKRAKEYGGKPPFMFVPGIDVPFHSRILRKGVPEFRDKLDSLLPSNIDYSRLVGRYIPNLVAVPFELTREFAQKILDVVPSERIEAALEDENTWKSYAEDEQKLGRLLLTELLSWQFASPVRWIETQALMFADRARGGLGVEEYVEVGLGNAPTLANLGAKTLALPDFSGEKVTVYNVGRDEGRVYMTDTDSLVPQSFDEEDSQDAAPASVPAATESSASATSAQAQAPASQAPAAATTSAAPASSGPVEDLPFKASDAISMLIAYSAKIRIDQIGDTDTTDTLTNGVSSRRNQLLMDISSELGVASVDGAAEAPMSALRKLVNSVAPRYKAFGAVLSDIVRERLRALFGAAGVKPAQVDKRISEVWHLGDGWRAHVLAALVLQTREGASVRGENLAQISTQPAKNVAAADALIDAAIEQVARANGVSISKPGASGSAGGAVVDSAALDAFAQRVVGSDGVLAATAKFVLAKLGVEAPKVENGEDENAAVVEAVESELGADWPKQVAPRFDERKAILFDDRWASAREDVARLYYEYALGDNNASSANDVDPSDVAGILNNIGKFLGAGSSVAAEADWFAKKSKEKCLNNLSAIFEKISKDARTSVYDASCAQDDSESQTRFASDIAVVTGVAPSSIAAQVVTGLLAGGATVIATSHSFKPSVKAWAKKAYRQYASKGSKLWLVPANLSSYRDVDALVKWVGTVSKKVSGAKTTILKPAYEPSLFFPFAAPPVHGTLADSGSLFESQSRLMLWGVERAIAGFAQIGADTDVQHRMHVVLPGSPNRGMFGGDGAYGEVKSAFDAIVNRAHAESVWSNRVTFAHPKIGWVRGTGLMGGNDPLVDVVERHGLTTYSTKEMANRLLDLCTKESREQALIAPLDVDLTGGLGKEPLDLNALRAEALEDQRLAAQANNGGNSDNATKDDENNASSKSTNKALLTPYVPSQPRVNLDDWKNVTARPEDEIVIVSVGELGPWGSGRTRFEAELGIQEDGSVELSAGAVLELAWNMGLLTWQDSPKPGWYDCEGTLVPEADIAEKYRDEVVARSGIRPFETGMGGDYKDGANEEEAEIFLDHDVSFNVPTEQIAREYVSLDESNTEISRDDESGEWIVTRKSGSVIRVPRRAAMTRTVGGQFPKGFDPLKWGIPASMVGSVDTIALWNIVTTVDAYISAGFTPSEILQSVHPSMVASTQGTGFGGMSSMRKLYLDRFLNHEIPTDVLQEALPNVVAAHVMQTYIGGYGNMIQPVSACATAAVSLEEGVDKIALGKADFVVTGAIDDIGVESVVGFGNMNATANSEEMYAKGIDPRFFSRANDRRRGGFLESQGGGTILITRGDIALKLGLPVAGVVGFIHSYADGIHTSIPAPGLGALAAGMGGAKSKLVRDLAALGVTPDDIAVVSKHDTSTNANDPNESELHNTLAHAIGRTEGNPLFVISQKTLTGHAKGGACIFQINGLTQLFRTGVIPGNISLDCVDPALERDDHMVWLRKPMRVGCTSIKAALATSLGFGHVSGFVALVHPGAFESAVAATCGVDALEEWRNRANARLAAGQRHLQEGMMGRVELFEPVENRHLLKDGTRMADGTRYNGHEAEKAMLLNPDARLNADGYYC